MVKNVKGRIHKHYCDKCGKLMYDEIPDKHKEPIMLCGHIARYYDIKRYCKTIEGTLSREYCEDCADMMRQDPRQARLLFCDCRKVK